MNHRSVLNIALSLALATAGSAFAQGNSQHQRNNRDCPNGNCADQNSRQRPDQNDRRQNSRSPQARNEWQDHYRRATRDDRGAGPDRSFRQGGRMPPEYRSRQYVVDDWRGHHLSPPPRGYHWVQSGSDYLLVAIGTGIILQLLLSN